MKTEEKKTVVLKNGREFKIHIQAAHSLSQKLNSKEGAAPYQSFHNGETVSDNFLYLININEVSAII